jgi:lipopolysaccharide export system protein LptA
MVLGAAFLLMAAPARADKTDRNQPLAFVADSAKVDELKQTNLLSGNVEITKGTIVIRADKVEVRQSREGHQSAVATGWPNKRAFFRQKREGSDEYLEGEAERMEYDSRSDTVRLVNQAVMRRFRGSTLADEVTGNTIAYDNTTEVFQVLGGSQSTATPGRVRGVLTPRAGPNGAGTPAPDAASAPQAQP